MSLSQVQKEMGKKREEKIMKKEFKWPQLVLHN
jgi:hypothetical protein